MFGMENDKSSPKDVHAPQFSFELEDEIKKNPKRKKEILSLVEDRITEIRKLLQKGCTEKTFAECEVLIQGYLALATTTERVKVTT